MLASSLHDRCAIDDSTRFGIDLEECESFWIFLHLFKDVDVIEEGFGVLDIEIWNILNTGVSRYD